MNRDQFDRKLRQYRALHEQEPAGKKNLRPAAGPDGQPIGAAPAGSSVGRRASRRYTSIAGDETQ